MERQHDRAALSFLAWRHRLEQVAEQHLQDELQDFLRLLGTVGTPLIEGLAVHFLYYDPRAQHVAVTGEFTDWGRTGVLLPDATWTDLSALADRFGVPPPERG